jgi:hypothetical protein
MARPVEPASYASRLRDLSQLGSNKTTAACGGRRTWPGVLARSCLGVVVLGALAYVAICGYMALSITRVERHPLTRSPEMYGLAYQSVQFPSRVDAISRTATRRIRAATWRA